MVWLAHSFAQFSLPKGAIALGTTLAILVPALAPVPDLGEYVSGTALHVLAFVTLPILAVLLWPAVHPLLHWMGLAAFGAAIEVLQGIMNLGREADWMDWISDVLAATIAIAVIWLVRRYAGQAAGAILGVLQVGIGRRAMGLETIS